MTFKNPLHLADPALLGRRLESVSVESTRTSDSKDRAPETSAQDGDGSSVNLLGHWLVQVSTGRAHLLERAGRKFRITMTEWFALRQLQRGGRTTQRQLARESGLTPPSVSRATTSLEKAGHVTRQIDPRDMRVVYVDLTETGRTLALRLSEIEGDVDQRLFGSLEQRTRHELAMTFQTMATILDGKQRK